MKSALRNLRASFLLSRLFSYHQIRWIVLKSTPADSLCQTLGQCRRAKNGGKRDTYPSLPISPAFSHKFSLCVFPAILEPGTGFPVYSTLTGQHPENSFFTDLQRLTLICLLNVVHSSVFFKAAWVIYIKISKLKQMTERRGGSKNIIVSRQRIQLNLPCREVAAVGRSETRVNVGMDWPL